MDQDAEGTGLIVRYGSGNADITLIDLASGAALDAPLADVLAAVKSIDLHGTLRVVWVFDGGDWLVEPSDDVVSVRWFRWSDNSDLLGKRTERTALLVQPEPGAQRIALPKASLRCGLDVDLDVGTWNNVLKTAKRDLLLIDSDPQVLLVVPHSGESFEGLRTVLEKAIDEQLAEARMADREAEERAREHAERSLAERSVDYAKSSSAADIFVNPYNFVPLPEIVAREAPCGHHRRHADRMSGRIDVTWVTQSPLLFGDGKSQGLEMDPSGGFRVPGTSLKGSLRSLHETITGSCLRVFDADFIPVYRQPAAVQSGRQLAVVSEVDRLGRPSKVRLCGAATWADVTLIHAVRGPNQLRTGDVFEVRSPKTHNRRGRDEFLAATGFRFDGQLASARDVVQATGRWVVLLSDAAARHTGHPYYAALGQVSQIDTPLSPTVAAQWAVEVEGAEDLRVRRKDSSEREWKSVKFAGRDIGKRREVPAMPAVGDVLWADVQAGRVVKLSASYLWRATGRGSAGERVPKDCLACGSPQLDGRVVNGHLCVSCRLFGSAGTDRRDDREGARQQSYRGQVRVSEMRIDSSRGLIDQELPPRGRPRAGAGQFTLLINDHAPEQSNEHLPASTWGSRREPTPPRRLRGRKFYWHGHTTEPEGGWRRDVARPHQQQRAMGAQPVQLVPTESTVRASVWFENLTEAELGSLIAAMDPTSLLGPERSRLAWRKTHDRQERRERLWTHMGGGKGLGFGSVETSTLTVFLEHDDRYRGAVAEPLDAGRVTQLVSAFRTSAVAHLAATWQELAAMLDPDRVNPKRVAYPPNNTWDSLNADRPNSHESFDKSFNHFKATRGGGQGQHAEDIESLPRPSDDRPWLAIRVGRQ